MKSGLSSHATRTLDERFKHQNECSALSSDAGSAGCQENIFGRHAAGVLSDEPISSRGWNSDHHGTQPQSPCMLSAAVVSGPRVKAPSRLEPAAWNPHCPWSLVLSASRWGAL